MKKLMTYYPIGVSCFFWALAILPFLVIATYMPGIWLVFTIFNALVWGLVAVVAYNYEPAPIVENTCNPGQPWSVGPDQEKVDELIKQLNKNNYEEVS